MQRGLNYPLQTEIGYWFVWSLKITADPTTHTNTRLNTHSSLLQRLNNFATTWKQRFNPWMLYTAHQSFHLDVAFICHSVLSSARFLSKSLTLAHCLSSWSPHQCISTLLQLLQDDCWALLNVSDRGFLSFAITFSVLLFLSYLYSSSFFILALCLLLFYFPFLPTSFHLYLFFPHVSPLSY